jgi:hypothetical protein|tara:strand:+ start:53851 stop:54483 length:633 start_codon:yes stop_codon:yes gene_type:complete
VRIENIAICDFYLKSILYRIIINNYYRGNDGTYENAIFEYENEDDDGKHRLIYAYFGLAIYISQCIEETFSNMLWTHRVCNDNVKTKKELNDIIDIFENSKKTMGNFINEVKKNYELPNELKDDLENILARRNFLVHKYFKLEVQKFHTEFGQKEMLKYFSNFIDETKIIDNKLMSYYNIYRQKLGITEESIEQAMAEMEKEEIERVNSL